MTCSTNILFTSQELSEFRDLYKDLFGEVITLSEASEIASDFVKMLYAFTKSEPLEVRYNNIALVNTFFSPQNDG